PRIAGPEAGSGPSRLRRLPHCRRERELLRRRKQSRRVEHDDRPPVLHDQARDVLRGEALHDRRGRRDLGGRDLQHLGDRVHDHAELAALPLEDHRARFLAQRRGQAEPLAEIHERHGDALVAQHALEEIGRLGERRRGLVPEDPLDLEDVEGQVLTGHLEGDQLDVVARGHPMCSPSASRSRIGTRAPRRRATPDAHGSDSPRGTGNTASRTTSSASSTSNATWRVPSPAPSVTSTAARPRSGGGARSPNRAPRCTTGTSRPPTAEPRSWAIPPPPAARIARTPSAPSRPIPVRTTPRLCAPNTWATERNSGSAAGRTPHTGGSWSSAIAGPSGARSTRI